VTTVIAIYAAVVASGALAFNVFSWWRTWATRVKVDLRRLQIFEPGAVSGPVVHFQLTNHSTHAVKVTHVGLGPVNKGDLHIWIPRPHGVAAPGPFEIPARDSVSVWIKPAELSRGDPKHRTRAIVKTSDGRSFRSKRTRVGELRGDA